MYVYTHTHTPSPERERTGEWKENMDFVCSSGGKTSNNRTVVKISSFSILSLAHSAQLQFPENYFIISESVQKSDGEL